MLMRAVVCSEGDSCSTGFSELSVTTSPSKSDPGKEATSAKAGNAYADYVRPIPCNFYDASGRAKGCASAALSMQLANCLRTHSRNCMHAVHGWSLSVSAVLYCWRLLLSIAADCNATVRSSLQAPETVICAYLGQPKAPVVKPRKSILGLRLMTTSSDKMELPQVLDHTVRQVVPCQCPKADNLHIALQLRDLPEDQQLEKVLEDMMPQLRLAWWLKADLFCAAPQLRGLPEDEQLEKVLDRMVSQSRLAWWSKADLFCAALQLRGLPEDEQLEKVLDRMVQQVSEELRLDDVHPDDSLLVLGLDSAGAVEFAHRVGSPQTLMMVGLDVGPL